MIDPDIHRAKALLVEGNALLRTVTASQLRDSGVGQVVTASDVKHARLMLERERFEIVLCSRNFEGEDDSGQDLLDELRRENLLPHSTVFIMVSERAVYHEVVEAAESALDGILVRPYTTVQLSKRLYDARHRKRELSGILLALDQGEIETAMVRALKRFQHGQPFAAWCGRLAAELMLRLNRPADALTLFEKLLASTGQAWAILGMARAQMSTGNLRTARQTVQRVLETDTASADAQDLAGRLLVEQCDFEAALAHYRRAAELTPGCLLRAQHAGALAFYQGQPALALECLERSIRLGVESKLFDALTLVLAALLRHDAGNVEGVAAMLRQLQRFRQRHPESGRLQRLEQAAQVLADLSGPNRASALSLLDRLTAQAGDDDFDLEAANLLLALWARLPVPEPSPEPSQQPPQDPLRPAHAAFVERAAMRFCVSKTTAEVLIGAARRDAAVAARVRHCQAQVSAISEQAMTQALKGQPEAAVRSLLDAGELHGNPKLLEMAVLLARRHAEQVPQAEAWAERAQQRLLRSCRTANHIAGLQRSGRSPGGLQLRGRAAPTEITHATT